MTNCWQCTLHEDFGKLLETRQFCDIEFVVGPDENPVRVPAHVALVAARSQWLRTRIRQAKEARDKHLEKVNTINIFFFRKFFITLEFWLGFRFLFRTIQRSTATRGSFKRCSSRSIWNDIELHIHRCVLTIWKQFMLLFILTLFFKLISIDRFYWSYIEKWVYLGFKMLYLINNSLIFAAGKEPATSNRVVLLIMDVYRLAVQVM